MMSQNIVLTTNVCRKNSQPAAEFFLFLGCISYTILVNIMSLSGTHAKKEPLVGKGSDETIDSWLCSFLYILDLSAFVVGGRTETMHKKLTFYTYACTVKYSLYGKNVLLFRW